MSRLTVTANRLNRRNDIPLHFPDPNGVTGEVLKGFIFERFEAGEVHDNHFTNIHPQLRSFTGDIITDTDRHGSSVLERITIDDIFAPGTYFVYGFGLPFSKDVPVSIGYRYKYGSKFYFKQQDGSLALSDHSRWRGTWLVGIDIPLTNFWTTISEQKVNSLLLKIS